MSLISCGSDGPAQVALDVTHSEREIEPRGNQKSLLCHLIGISGLLKEMFSESQVEQSWSPMSLIWNLTLSRISSTPFLGYCLRGLLIELLSQIVIVWVALILIASGIFFQGLVHSSQALCH